jgi:hypothetical protein
VKNKKVKTENKTRRQGTRYSGQEKKTKTQNIAHASLVLVH